MHIKKGDLVQIISGSDRKLGPARVIRVLPTENRVVVEGRNLVKKHVKGNPALGRQSAILEIEAPVHASNVALFSQKLQRPVRTQMRWLGADGKAYESEQSAAATFATAPSRIRKVRYSTKADEIFE